VGWWAGGIAGSAGFAGRARELSCLRAALGGDARLLLVAGGAGVGKTRFTREAMRLAAGSVRYRGQVAEDVGPSALSTAVTGTRTM
jgi:hypothetical protein